MLRIRVAKVLVNNCVKSYVINLSATKFGRLKWNPPFDSVETYFVENFFKYL